MAITHSNSVVAPIYPKELVINLTNRCPLKCSHCCFSSDSQQLGHLGLEYIIRAVDDASQLEGLTRVNFVGGEPLLFPEVVEAGCYHAKQRGLDASITTSGHWAKSLRHAEKTLLPLVSAGLTRIIVSYDDPHAEFLSDKHIINAYQASCKLGLHIKIAIAVEPNSKINSAYVAQLLGVPIGGNKQVQIYETAINSTGRAVEGVGEQERIERRQTDRAYRGSCESILRQISIHPKGDITICCGVLPLREQLRIGNIREDALNDRVSEAYQKSLFKWIAFEGPVAILRQITADTNNPLYDDDFDGICHACDVLFTNPKYMRLLQAMLPSKLHSLRVQEVVYTALNSIRQPSNSVTPCLETEGASGSIGQSSLLAE